MSAPRGLTAEEAAAWDKVAETVKPLDPAKPVSIKASEPSPITAKPPPAPRKAKPKPPARPATPIPVAARAADRSGNQGTLDSHRDRRLKKGDVAPDFTLDLHGHGLDAAYDRLMSGIAQARAMDARTILLVTGKPRPVDPADRGTARGAIRAKVLDWLAASNHHSAIAAVRRAHIRHGGEGALYIVLKRGG